MSFVFLGTGAGAEAPAAKQGTTLADSGPYRETHHWARQQVNRGHGEQSKHGERRGGSQEDMPILGVQTRSARWGKNAIPTARHEKVANRTR